MISAGFYHPRVNQNEDLITPVKDKVKQ